MHERVHPSIRLAQSLDQFLAQSLQSLGLEGLPLFLKLLDGLKQHFLQSPFTGANRHAMEKIRGRPCLGQALQKAALLLQLEPDVLQVSVQAFVSRHFSPFRSR